MTIRSIDLGNHDLEIDTTYGMVTIYSTGYRLDLSLREASKMLSAMLLIVNPSSMLQPEDIDTLDVSAIGNPSEKTERVLTHVDSLASQHFTECSHCMKVLQASYCDNLEGVVSQIATCLAKAEGVKPYLEAGIITIGNIEYLLAHPLQKILDKINVTVCSGCANGWCEGCVPDESVLDETCYICYKPVPYEAMGNGEEAGIRACAYCDRVVCSEHSFTDETGYTCCIDSRCKSTQAEAYANSYLGIAPSEISEEAKQRYAKLSQSEAYRQFLENTVNDEEYNAWLDHTHTPKAEDY